MNKRSVTLGAMAGVLVLALGAYVGVTRWNAAQAAADSAAAADIEVATLAPGEVAALTADVQGESLSLKKEGDTWRLADDPSFPLGQSYVQTMLETVAPLTAQGPLQDVQDPGEYGLSDGCDRVTLTNGDGKQVTLLLGDTSSLTGQVYAAVEGEGDVYLAAGSVRAPFTHTREELLQKEPIPTMDDFISLSVENAAGAWEYTFPGEEEDASSGGGSQGASSASGTAADSGAQGASAESEASASDSPAPGAAQEDASSGESQSGAGSASGGEDGAQNAGDEAKARELADALSLLAWEKCVSWNADPADYGLDAPAAAVTAVYTAPAADGGEAEEKTFTLLIGQAGDDGYYAALPGSRMVYTISSDVARLFLP